MVIHCGTVDRKIRARINAKLYLVPEKQIKIAGVYYGMLDVTKELKYTPVVDLKSLFDITSWIKGAYSLESYGDGSLIAELLQNKGETDLASKIESLSQSININHVNAIKQRSSILKNSLQRQVTNSPFDYVRRTLEKFVNKFARSTSRKESDYQLELAEWYFDNKRYATGYITLTEAIITYICEINNKDIKVQQNRDNMKDFLHDPNNRNSKLAQLYFQVNPIRKSIAHALLDRENQAAGVNNAIKNAKTYHQEAKKIFRTGTLDY